MPQQIPVIRKMTDLATEWEHRRDARAIFLRCYSMMTHNMFGALVERRFEDNEWVEKLLHRFADYYFEALACYDCGESVPPVWQRVHEKASENQLHTLQHLLLGVNAHINYDLVLTLHEILQPEWPQLSEADRKLRYRDHCLVNTIIGETIDAVQDQVVEKYAPMMEWVDRAFGRLDEFLITGLIRRWREEVWHHTMQMLEEKTDPNREKCRLQLEKEVLDKCRWLEMKI